MIEDCCQKEHGLGTLVAEFGARSTEVDEVWLCSVLRTAASRTECTQLSTRTTHSEAAEER